MPNKNVGEFIKDIRKSLSARNELSKVNYEHPPDLLEEKGKS